ncbi:MAG TPA: RDD family protein [Rhodocyclaceae bacterium]|nr:RDD family protein [Rhodocyclaceae bacterium]
MLDTLRLVTTPELIELQLHPAGVLPRTLAYIVDMTLKIAIVIAAGKMLSALGGAGNGMWLLLFFALEWFYPVLFEVLRRGATPGKRALGLVVLHEDGTPVGWGPSMTRNLLRAADFLPVGYVFGIVSMLLHPEFRRLGDIVAGTLVVYRDVAVELPDIASADPIAPAMPLNRATQRALLSFAERARGLTPARQEELAEWVPHLAHGERGPQGAARLIGLANFLIGRKS